MKKIISAFLVILLAFNLAVVTYAVMPGYVQSVEISGNETITMYVGDELALEATATPVGFDYSYMIWTTSEPSVINLIGDDGTTEYEPPISTATITALSEGTAIVTVYADLTLPETEDYTTHDFVTINVLPKENTSSLRNFSMSSYNSDNEIVRQLSCVIESLNDDIVLDMENMSTAPEQSLYNLEYDLLVLLDLKSTDENNLYPQIEETSVNLGVSILGGGTSHRLGKNYKAFLMVGDNKEEISVTELDAYNITFNISTLGKYVIYFDEYDEYVVNFYNEIPPGNSEEAEYIYRKIENLQANDIVVFPEIPKKDNYVFTGWKVWSGGGIYFAEPQPFAALDNYGNYYATWCPEDEYEPIVLNVSSDEPIVKGEENGKKITLKTNYGIFTDEDFPSKWRDTYDSEPNEEYKADILADWKSKWNVAGTEDILVETATRIDDKTVELTLSGNSKDIYSNTDIYIEFDSFMLLPEPYEKDGEVITWDDTKIKMDSYGVRAKMYRSDNSVTLSGQKRPDTGGGGSAAFRYIVTFDTNGGNNIKIQSVNRNATIKEPEEPMKDGFIFVGWFTDKDLTEEFDFTTKITKSITLYAKWNESDNCKDNDGQAVSENDLIYYIASEKLRMGNVIFPQSVEKPYDDMYDKASISRAEFSVVLLNALREETPYDAPLYPEKTYFSDCDIKAWYTDRINRVYELKIASGYGDGTFKPENCITNLEAVTMVVRALGYENEKTESTSYPQKYIEIAKKLNLLNNTTISEIEDAHMTYGNMFVMLINALRTKILGTESVLWDLGVKASKYQKISGTVSAIKDSKFVLLIDSREITLMRRWDEDISYFDGKTVNVWGEEQEDGFCIIDMVES